MKKLFIMLAVLAICLAFSGCTVFETDTEALMKPPVFTAEQEKLNAALTNVIGESYILKYPKNGEQNSAFVFEDLDGDGVEEALAFYSLLDESTRVNVLKKEGENWKSVYEAAGFYGNIEKIDFVKIDEKYTAVAIKWEQEAAVYRYEKERLITMHRAECDGVEICDVNGDGFCEVVLFGGDLSGRNILNLVYSKEGEVTVTETANIHTEYEKIYSVTTGKISEDKTALFVDFEIYEGVYLTEIITLEGEKANRSFIADFVEYEDEEVRDESTSGTVVVIGGNYGKRGIFLRNTKVYCMDTNGDGIVEMPSEVREDYAQEKTEEIFLLQYMQYNGTESLPVWNGVANTAAGYIFALPESWNGKVFVEISSDGEEMTVREKESKKAILSVYSVSKSEYQDEYEDYILGDSKDDKNYYVKFAEENESKIEFNPEEFEINFIFI